MRVTFFEILRFAWVTSELIRSLTRRALTGSSSLTRTRTVGCEGFSDAERLELRDQVRRQDQGREHVARLDHVAAPALAGHRDAVDPRAELAASAGDVELGAAERRTACPGEPR